MKDLESLSKPELIAEILALREGQQTETEDIAENSVSETQLRACENRFRTLLNQVGDAMYLCNLEGQIKLINNHACEMLGYNDTEFLNLTVSDLDINYSDPESQKELWNRLELNVPVTLLTKHKHKDGSSIPVEVQYSLILFDGHRAILGFARDISEQKQTKEKLKESEQKFSILYNNSPDMHASVSPVDASILMCNATLLRATGYSKEEVIGAPIFNIYHEECMADVKRAFTQFVETGEVRNRELILKRKDGSKIEVNLNVVGVRDETGRIIHSVSSWRDLTDQKKAEKLFEDQCVKWKTTFDAMTDAVSIIDLDGNISQHNAAFQSLLNVDEETIKHKKCYEVFHGTKTFLHNCPFLRMKESLRPESIILNTNDKWLEINVDPIFNSKHELTGAVHIATDITKRKQAEEKIRFQANLLDAVQQAVIVTNTAGEIIYWNPFAESIYGWSAAEVMGRRINEITVSKHSKRQGDEIMHALLAGESWSGEFDVQHRDGTIFPSFVSDSPIYNEQGELVAIIGISIDISERKKNEVEMLKQKNMFELVINSVPTRIFWKDLSSNYLGCNKAFLEVVKKERSEDVIGKNDYDLLWAAEAEKYITDDSEVLKTGVSKLGFKESYILPDGQKVWWQTSKMPLKDSSGKTIGILATAEDITEQLLANKKLEESELRFRALHDASFGGIAIHDRGIIKECNQGLADITGYSVEELIGMDGLLCIAEDSREIVNHNIKSSYEKAYEVVGLRKNGEEYSLRIDAKMIPYKGKNMRVVEFRDITARKHAEEELKLNRVLFRTLLDIIPVFICAKNRDGKFLFVNKKLTDFYGSTVEAMTNVFHADLCEDEDELCTMLADDREVIESGKPKFIPEETMESPDGSITILETYKIPFTALGENAVLIASNDITDRKLAEDKLKKSLIREKLMATIVRESVVGIAVGHLDGSLGLCNAAYQNITGYSDEELKTVDWNTVLTPPEYRAGESAILQELQKTKKSVKYEKEYIRKDGSRVPVELIVNLQLNHKGEGESYFAFVIDITDRKLADEKLRASEERFKALYNNAPLAYQSLDADGRFNDINPTWLSTLGYKREEVVGKFYKDFLHPDWQQSFEKNFPAFKKRGYVNDVQFKLRHKAGHYIYISFEGCVGYHPDGSFKQTYCVFQDITARKEAEEALQQNEEKLNLIISTSPIGICTVDILGNFTTTNQAYERILGYTKEELAELSFFEVTHPDYRPKNKELFHKMFSLKTAGFSIEKKYIRKDGKEITVSIHAVGIKDDAGKIKYGTAFVEDITERKLAEEEILKYQEQLEELVKKRTRNLEEKNRELERFNDLFVDREFRIKELKDELKTLKR